MITYTSKKNICMDLNLLENNEIIWHMKLLQGGKYIKQIDQGIFAFNYMGSLVVNNISNILRRIFIEIGGSELIFPIVQGKKMLDESGRLNKYEKTIEKVNNNLILSPSHEELCNYMIGESLSYKNLPIIAFSFGHCFRNEIRPKNGLLRTKDFILFDGYAFSQDLEQHNSMFHVVRNCFKLFLSEIELNFEKTFFKTNDEDEFSEEFVVKTEHIGEKRILHCFNCGLNYRASQFKRCNCGGDFVIQKGIEFADLIRNGITFSKKTKSFFVSKSGKLSHYYMLSFGLGISKLIAVIVELSKKSQNFNWPLAISPFKISIIIHKNSKNSLSSILENKKFENIDILVDDRDLSIGRRILENTLLGIPLILTVKDCGRKFEFINRIIKQTFHFYNINEINF